MIRVLVALLLLASVAEAQQLRSGEETISVSSTAVGITDGLCGAGNRDGAYIQVTSNGIYFSLHGSAATPDSGDFLLNAGTTGPQLWVKPARLLRMIRQSADSNVKVQCTD